MSAPESVNGKEISQKLLDWYDRDAREFPWRVSPSQRRSGKQADPYHVWLSEIMLQQTGTKTVIPYFNKFVTQWPDLVSFSAASEAELMAAWAGLGYYSRARNMIRAAKMLISDHEGVFPQNLGELQSLPGVGPYTAAAIAAIAFDRAETVVDGNVERVVARLFGIETPLPEAKAELYRRAKEITPEKRPGDYAQAVMDLGATICTPRSPKCLLCPIRAHCLGHMAGTQEQLPVKLPKLKKPKRLGLVYLACREDGAILVEDRPKNGLLGGMLGLPCSEWLPELSLPDHNPPIEADWITHNDAIRHIFTHFELKLTLLYTTVSQDSAPGRGRFLLPAEFDPTHFPTLFRKVFKVFQALN